MGKRKREMELVQDKQERMVTFSKRRQGLFKKAQEPSKLSSCEIAIITFSGAGKAFTFRSFDFDEIISHYLSMTSTSPVKGLQVECQLPNHLEHHVMEVANQEFEQENLFVSQTHQMVSSSSSITAAELLPPLPEHQTGMFDVVQGLEDLDSSWGFNGGSDVNQRRRWEKNEKGKKDFGTF